MAGSLDDADLRTQVAGQNRLEMLMFRLHGKQLFGINVFKVQKVIQCPPLTVLPGSNPVIRGVACMRGSNIPVMDLSHAVGGPMMGNPSDYFVIITEYNRRMLGFLVGSVERIININWESVLPPPSGVGHASYMTAVTKVDDQLVEIIDVEKVLSEILGIDETIHQTMEALGSNLQGKKILIVDDSIVARKQISRVLDAIGIEYIVKGDGSEALKQLEEWAEEGQVSDWLTMVISDIEMPKMDGYALVSAIRSNPKLADLFVIMHSSLSGAFNEAMVKKVGADHFLAKFNPNDLVDVVTEHLKVLE